LVTNKNSYWHGCDKCFSRGDLLADGRTCGELNDATMDRLRQLREPDNDGNCIEVEEIWVRIRIIIFSSAFQNQKECEVMHQLSKNEEMRQFFKDLGKERGPIDPRMAYCGGLCLALVEIK